MDLILNGGFVKGGVYLLLGPPGTGKTIFANQMCFHHAKMKTGNIVYVTLLAESHGRMMENLRPLDYFQDKDVSESIHYMGGYHVLEKEGLKGFLRLIAGIVKEKNASILMIDGMSTIGELEQSAITFRKFAHELNSYLSSSGCTAFLLSSMEGHLSKPEHTMVDGIISFHYENDDTRVTRKIEVRKFRGSSHFYGKHFYTINDSGITIYPKIESIHQSHESITRGKKRLTFKIDGLDEMMRGGLFSNTITSLIGAAGTGKTTLGLQFLAAGAEDGQNGVFFGLYEKPEELMDKAEGLSLSFHKWVKKKNIEIVWHPQLELELDQLSSSLIETVKKTGAKRVVIDGIDGLRLSSASPKRLFRYMTALTLELKKLGSTILIIEEVSTFGSYEGRQIAELSAINEVVIYLHQDTKEDKIFNGLSILKMRNSAFDKRTKELIIDEEGIFVEDIIASPKLIVEKTSGPFKSEKKVKKKVIKKSSTKRRK
jgi:circadian clock protein KaiC